MTLDSDGLALFVAAGGAATMALLVFLLGLALAARRDRTRRRIDMMQRRWMHGAAVEVAGQSLRRSTDTAFPGLDEWLRTWLPRREALRNRLARTGRGMSIPQYLLLCLACCALTAILLRLFLTIPAGVVALGALFSGLWLPHALVGFLIRARAAKFVGDFPDAIDLIVRGIKSGLPIQETIGTIATEIPEPIGGEFRRIEAALKLGQTLDEALWATADRVDIAEFRFFVISLSVQRETGGNLAETLENLSDLLRRRRQMKLKIRALSSEARASAYIIGSLPFAMTLILFFINRGYVMQLFSDPRGMVLVGAGLASIGIGAIVMAKMVRFEI
jgi:tight adherence protein B